MVLHLIWTAGYVIKIHNITLYKLQNNIRYPFMGWGVTLQKHSLIRYPKIIGNPIERIVKCFLFTHVHIFLPGRVAQSVTCLATDACLTADPGVASSIPARSHTFVEIDHEIISTVILLPSADSFKKVCCQLQAKVCAQITG